MQISNPTWDSATSSYTFKLYGDVPTIESASVYIDPDNKDAITLPDISELAIVNPQIVDDFIEKTARWFQTPLRPETMKKRLRHKLDISQLKQNFSAGWHSILFKPVSMIVTSKEFTLDWVIAQLAVSAPTISADFLVPTPRARSPEPDAVAEKELRTIHIQNGLETVVPIGDLPLSDLPPLSFQVNEDDSDATKSEKKRHIREARLRVALAKLKAKRMEEKYYMKYGEYADNSDSSYLSSDSDSDEYFQRDH